MVFHIDLRWLKNAPAPLQLGVRDSACRGVFIADVPGSIIDPWPQT
jgi:hypothetical protein